MPAQLCILRLEALDLRLQRLEVLLLARARGGGGAAVARHPLGLARLLLRRRLPLPLPLPSLRAVGRAALARSAAGRLRSLLRGGALGLGLGVGGEAHHERRVEPARVRRRQVHVQAARLKVGGAKRRELLGGGRVGGRVGRLEEGGTAGKSSISVNNSLISSYATILSSSSSFADGD